MADYCRQWGVRTTVVRNDAVTAEDLSRSQALLLSPGPGGPRDAGVCGDAVRRLTVTPMLGVCLGHQVIVDALGGMVRRGRPVHGRQAVVRHDGSPLFESLPAEVRVGRYHSLQADADSVPDGLRVTAVTRGGTVMAVEHDSRPVYGVQFHPESVLTDGGMTMVGNFLRLAGFDVAPPARLKAVASEASDDFYERPVTGSARPL